MNLWMAVLVGSKLPGAVGEMPEVLATEPTFDSVRRKVDSIWDA